jgi:hypothetical protein
MTVIDLTLLKKMEFLSKVLCYLRNTLYHIVSYAVSVCMCVSHELVGQFVEVLKFCPTHLDTWL